MNEYIRAANARIRWFLNNRVDPGDYFEYEPTTIVGLSEATRQTFETAPLLIAHGAVPVPNVGYLPRWYLPQKEG